MLLVWIVDGFLKFAGISHCTVQITTDSPFLSKALTGIRT